MKEINNLMRSEIVFLLNREMLEYDLLIKGSGLLNKELRLDDDVYDLLEIEIAQYLPAFLVSCYVDVEKKLTMSS